MPSPWLAPTLHCFGSLDVDDTHILGVPVFPQLTGFDYYPLTEPGDLNMPGYLPAETRDARPVLCLNRCILPTGERFPVADPGMQPRLEPRPKVDTERCATQTAHSRVTQLLGKARLRHDKQ